MARSLPLLFTIFLSTLVLLSQGKEGEEGEKLRLPHALLVSYHSSSSSLPNPPPPFSPPSSLPFSSFSGVLLFDFPVIQPQLAPTTSVLLRTGLQHPVDSLESSLVNQDGFEKIVVSSLEEIEKLSLGGGYFLIVVKMPEDSFLSEQWISSVQQKLSEFDYISAYSFPSFIPQKFNPRKRAVSYAESGNLFEVYTFFSAGIWMGIITTLVLLVILIGGIMWISDLQTPTKFEKNS